MLLRSISSFRAKNRKGPTPQKQHEIVAILKTYTSLSSILYSYWGWRGKGQGYLYRYRKEVSWAGKSYIPKKCS